MDHKIPQKNHNEFFNNKSLNNLNDQLCQHIQDNMFEQEILDNLMLKY